MRRIKQGIIKFISLVPRGANRLPVIYKSDDNTVLFDPIVKADMEKGELFAVVYAPEVRDSQGDVASASVIKDMAYRFQKDGLGIDIRHNDTPVAKTDAFVAESFIIQKNDPRFNDMKDYDGNPVDVTGGWGVVIKIENEDLKKAYREGKWNGVSMGGSAIVEAEKEDSRIIAMLKSFLGRNHEGDFDMKPEDLAKALADQAKVIQEGLVAAFKEAGIVPAKKDDPAPLKGAPKFTGDIRKEEDRRNHRKALAIWKAEQDHANDPVALFDAIEKIEQEFEGDLAELNKAAGVTEKDTPEVAELRRRLYKAESKSNQPVKDRDAALDISPGFSAEDAALAKEAIESVRKEHYGEGA